MHGRRFQSLRHFYRSINIDFINQLSLNTPAYMIAVFEHFLVDVVFKKFRISYNAPGQNFLPNTLPTRLIILLFTWTPSWASFLWTSSSAEPVLQVVRGPAASGKARLKWFGRGKRARLREWRWYCIWIWIAMSGVGILRPHSSGGRAGVCNK